MSKKDLKLVKKLGTLLVVGLILVSHSPVTALAADDVTLPENQTPTVENVATNNEEAVQVIEVTTADAGAKANIEPAADQTTDQTTEQTTEQAAEQTAETTNPVEPVAPLVAPEEVAAKNNNLFAISEEIGGPVVTTTTTINNNPLVVSPEIGGQTVVTRNNNGQGTFTTLPTNNNSSGQNTFTTLPNGGCNSGCGGGSQTTGAQGSFTTLPSGTISPTSSEGSFTTQNNGGGGGGGGCSSNCGGSVSYSAPAPLPLPCELYLKKFIRLGYANDPFEVTKLEVFLNSFEGFNLPVNGIYEQRDFDAVSIFQQRYLGAVLTPWGITDSTGYVYITTTLTINQIYCQHTVGNNLDLSHIYPVYGAADQTGVPAVTGLEATTTPTTTPSLQQLPALLQAAAVGALNFIKDWWCLIIIILLILLIAYLLDERERLKRKLKDSQMALNEVSPGAVPIAMLLPKEGEEEWATLDKSEPDVDPNQEPLTKL